MNNYTGGEKLQYRQYLYLFMFKINFHILKSELCFMYKSYIESRAVSF